MENTSSLVSLDNSVEAIVNDIMGETVDYAPWEDAPTATIEATTTNNNNIEEEINMENNATIVSAQVEVAKPKKINWKKMYQEQAAELEAVKSVLSLVNEANARQTSVKVEEKIAEVIIPTSVTIAAPLAKEIGGLYNHADAYFLEAMKVVRSYLKATPSIKTVNLAIAQGLQLVTALTIKKLIEQGTDVKLNIIVPCSDQTAKWQVSADAYKMACRFAQQAKTLLFNKKTLKEDPKCFESAEDYAVKNSDAVIVLKVPGVNGHENKMADKAKTTKKSVIELQLPALPKKIKANASAPAMTTTVVQPTNNVAPYQAPTYSNKTSKGKANDDLLLAGRR